jgi:5-methylcytosine-specific restriction endonuclease McrA
VPETVMCPNIKIPKSIPDCNRRNLYIRDKGVCGYCGAVLRFNESTKDHIYPSSKGGQDKWDNVVLACKECNQKKGHTLPADIQMEIKTRIYTPTWYELLLLNYKSC